jgi:hypothetical protein
MLDAEAFGDQPVLGSDDVVVAVMGKLGAQGVARLARAAAADAVGQDDKILRGVERLAGGTVRRPATASATPCRWSWCRAAGSPHW